MWSSLSTKWTTISYIFFYDDCNKKLKYYKQKKIKFFIFAKNTSPSLNDFI